MGGYLQTAHTSWHGLTIPKPKHPLLRPAAEGLAAGVVSDQLINEHWPEEGLPDHVGLKRAREADLEFFLTVSAVKGHVDEHVVYSWGDDGLSPGVSG